MNEIAQLAQLHPAAQVVTIIVVGLLALAVLYISYKFLSS